MRMTDRLAGTLVATALILAGLALYGIVKLLGL
jgi:hypothetical protein